VVAYIVAEVRSEQVQMPSPPQELRLHVVDEDSWCPFYDLYFGSSFMPLSGSKSVDDAFACTVDE